MLLITFITMFTSTNNLNEALSCTYMQCKQCTLYSPIGNIFFFAAKWENLPEKKMFNLYVNTLNRVVSSFMK